MQVNIGLVSVPTHRDAQLHGQVATVHGIEVGAFGLRRIAPSMVANPRQEPIEFFQGDDRHLQIVGTASALAREDLEGGLHPVLERLFKVGHRFGVITLLQPLFRAFCKHEGQIAVGARLFTTELKGLTEAVDGEGITLGFAQTPSHGAPQHDIVEFELGQVGEDAFGQFGFVLAEEPTCAVQIEGGRIGVLFALSKVNVIGVLERNGFERVQVGHFGVPCLECHRGRYGSRGATRPFFHITASIDTLKNNWRRGQGDRINVGRRAVNVNDDAALFDFFLRFILCLRRFFHNVLIGND